MKGTTMGTMTNTRDFEVSRIESPVLRPQISRATAPIIEVMRRTRTNLLTITTLTLLPTIMHPYPKSETAVLEPAFSRPSVAPRLPEPRMCSGNVFTIFCS